MLTYTVWGPNHDESTTLVNGTNPPKFANGKIDPEAKVLIYTIEAVDFDDAVK